MSEWTSIAQPMHYIVELDAPLTVRRERGVLVQGDKNANAFVVAIYQTKGVAADMTGCTVNLHFVRPDNLAVMAIEATIEGNVATATLTETCYRLSGMYGALVTMAKDGAERTILKTIGDMISTENNGTVTEEQILPTPEELLETLEQVEQARNNANTAANAANAAAQSATSAASSATGAAAQANKWAMAEATASSISAESQPTVEVSEADGKKVIHFGIPAGKTPNLTFAVETGEPGTNVEIQQSGTPEEPVIALTIPRGDTGAVDGIDYYTGNPSELGTASPGTATGLARGDHVHPIPAAKDVGAVTMLLRTATLPASRWSQDDSYSPIKQYVSVPNVPEAGDDNAVLVVAAPGSYVKYHACGVRCTDQGNWTLGFTCTTIPDEDLTVNVMLLS